MVFIFLVTMAFEDYFSFQIFFIFLRESLEIVVIVSILLTIVKQGLSVEDDSPFEGSSSSAGLPSPNTNTNADSTTAFLQAGPSDGNAIGTSATAANNKSRPLNVEEEEEIYEYSNELRNQDRESDEHIGPFHLGSILKNSMRKGLQWENWIFHMVVPCLTVTCAVSSQGSYGDTHYWRSTNGFGEWIPISLYSVIFSMTYSSF